MIINFKETETMKTETHFNLPNEAVYTFPASSSNEITKDYYNFLVGEINRGTILKAVMRIDNYTFSTTRYFLISER
jgi:hypothetical protein